LATGVYALGYELEVIGLIAEIDGEELELYSEWEGRHALPCLRFIEPFEDVIFSTVQLSLIEEEIPVLEKEASFPGLLGALKKIMAFREADRNAEGSMMFVRFEAD
jgi:hypothetical protein